MSIVTEITRINTNIANSYTAVDNKNGTLPQVQNSANLASAIDSIEVIEQATAEGESLSLTNTKAMPYSDYVVKGKSEQATRSGKNLFKNIPFTSTQRGLTITNDGNSIKVTGTAVPEYYSSIIFYADGSYENYEWWATDGKINPTKGYFNSNQAKNVLSVISNNVTTEPWFRLLIGRETQVEATNVNFGETSTTIFNENTEKINFIALGFLPDKTYNTEFKIQLEQGSTPSSYEPYGASPSPDYPSEIHSVADNDINIFNAEKIENYGIKVKDNGKTIIMPLATSGNGNTNTNTTLSVLCPDLQVGDVIYIRFKRNLNNNRNKFIYLYGSNRLLNASEDSPSYTITQDDLNSSVFLYGNDYDYGETEQCIITDFKIQKNTVPIKYSPYNQGTVTIKQENIKNYLNWDKFIDYSNWTNSNSLGYKCFEITGLNINKTYTLCRTDTAGYGETSKYAGFNKGNNNGNMFLHSTNSSRNLQSVSDTPLEDGKIYITMYMSSQSDLNDYIAIIKKCWIIEGTDYEPYPGNDYTLQTEPLRSLPNGVKDTMELQDMQNHTRIGRQTGTLTETTTITLSDAKTNGAYMCNIKPSGTLTGKTIELEAGDYEIIYELEEEIIEPLTQNQATTMLDIIKTGSYEGTTNIYTDEDVKPTIGVEYYKKG